MTARFATMHQSQNCCASVAAVCTSARICSLLDTAARAVSILLLLRLIVGK